MCCYSVMNEDYCGENGLSQYVGWGKLVERTYELNITGYFTNLSKQLTKAN